MRSPVAVAVFAAAFLTPPALAQSPRGPSPAAGGEECPQGRVIRAQKHYPPNMTDCQVLDADTAAENQRLRRQPAPRPPVNSAQPLALAPAPAPLRAPAPPALAPVSPVTQSPPIERPAAPPPAASLPVDYTGRLIGQWLTSAEHDRFGDGGTFTALTGDGTLAFGVRCIQKVLSIALMDIGADQKPLSKGDLFKLKFRVDTQPVVDTAGIAINDRLIQVDTEKSLVKAVRDGRETAIRMETMTGVISTHVYRTVGAPAAFADLSRECPLE